MSAWEVPVSKMPDVRVDVTTNHADYFTQDKAAVRASMPLAGGKFAGFVVTSRALLDDAAFDAGAIVDRCLDRAFRPWRYPDRNPMPRFRIWRWWRG